MAFERATRHCLFDPTADLSQSETSDHKIMCDTKHLMLIEKICNRIPRDWARTGQHYNALFQNGELIAEDSVEDIDLVRLLRRYDVAARDAIDLAQFLEAMLAIVPGQRLTAEEMLQSLWLLAG
jgi:hypothetical protein